MRFSLLPIFALAPAMALGQSQFTCQRTDSPAPARSEGYDELLGDIVLTCKGGTPPTSGASLGLYDILVSATVPLTSRLLPPAAPAADPATGPTEALLLIDEPSYLEQIGCAQQTGMSRCPAYAGTSSNPNVYQGWKLQENVIAFRQIPINPPGPNGTRTIRIVNVRANMASLATQSLPRVQQLSIQMYAQAGGTVTISNAATEAAVLNSGMTFAVRAAGDMPLAIPGPALTIPPASVPALPEYLHSFSVKFSEGFPSAFRRRNVGTSGDDPLFATVQATPGIKYNTESGIFNPLLPSITRMNEAGLADSGTRLFARFKNVPAGVALWVSHRDAPNGTTGYSSARPKAVLIDADANGTGEIKLLEPEPGASFVNIPVTNGTATVVWEIVGSDPDVLENVSFEVAISKGVGSVAQGAATVSGSLGPLGTGSSLIPAFTEVSTPIPAFAVSNVVALPQLWPVNAASYSSAALAPDSIGTVFGAGLAAATVPAESIPLPLTLSDVTVDVVDNSGARREAPLFMVSPNQINFMLDAATDVGPALIRVARSGRIVASGMMQVRKTAPALFSADATGTGVPCGQILHSRNGTTVEESIAVYDSSGKTWSASPIDLSRDDEYVFLVLYGTGFRNRQSLSDVSVTIGSTKVPVIAATAQSEYVGLDQLNIGPLPKSLAGSGMASLSLTVAGATSNALTIAFKQE